MASPFDPSTWWPRPSRSSPEQGWLDSWLEVTTWWVEPARSLAERARRADPRVVLVEIVEGISRQFESHHFDAVVRSTRVSGLLESIRLVRTNGVEARLDMSDVRIGDLVIERVSATVSAVALQLGLDVRLSSSSSTVQLRVGVAQLLDWLQPSLPASWSVRVDDSGAVWAKHERRNIELLIDPSWRDERVDLEVRAVRVGGRVVRVPRWFRPTRTITPPLPSGLEVVGGFKAGAHIEATIVVPPFDERVDLAQLRDAVARRQMVAIG